jgi:hypothetical protein
VDMARMQAISVITARSSTVRIGMRAGTARFGLSWMTTLGVDGYSVRGPWC